MRKRALILVAGLVALAFAGGALAQTQVTQPPQTQSAAPSIDKASAKPGKRKAKRLRKHRRAKRAAKRSAAAKAN